MLKLLLDTAGYDALDAALQALYEKKEDGKFHLKVEDDNKAELMRAKQHEKEKRQAAEAKLAEIEKDKQDALDAKTKAEADAAKKKGDVEALEASWEAREKAAVAKEAARADKAEAALNRALKKNVAQAMASDISTAPDLLADKIESRLSVEITTDGDAITRVLDATGKPSALTVADLQKEFVDNPSYAAIIKGSDASGGGAKGGQGQGGDLGTKKLSEMTATEEAAFANANPAEYQKMLNA